MASSRSRSSGRMRGGLGQGVQAVQPLAHLPAEAAGAGLVQQRQEQLVLGVLLALPGRRQRGLLVREGVAFCSASYGLGLRVGRADHAPRRADDAAHQRQHQQARPPAPAPCSAARTSAAGSRPTAGTPAPARRPGSAARPRRSRWPSRSGGCGPSPAPSSRSSPARRAPACVSLRRLGAAGWPRSTAAPRPSRSAACSAGAAPPRG